MDISPPPISADTFCIHCQYNLRTRTSADRCPECGNPVADTLEHHKSHATAIAQPALLRTTATLFAIPCILSLLTFAGLTLLKASAKSAGTPLLIALEAVFRQTSRAAFAIALFLATVSISGALTRQLARRTTRTMISLLTAVYAGLNVLLLLPALGMFVRPGGRPGRLIFITSILRDQRLGAAILCIGLAAAGYSIFRQVAKSLASPPLTAWTRFIFPALLADGIFSLAVLIFLRPWEFSRDLYPFDAVYTAMDFASAALLTLLGYYLFLLARTLRSKSRATPAPAMIPPAPVPAPLPEKLKGFLSRRDPQA